MTALAITHELKGLQVQLVKESSALKLLKEEAAALQRKVGQSQACVNSLEKRIAEMTTKAPEAVVSEHAILRYLERKKGIDLASVTAEILGNGTDKAIGFMKTGVIKKDDLTLVVKNNVVLTVK
jgi:hypothetical protein